MTKPRVLISDSMSSQAAAIFEERGIDVVQSSKLTEAELNNDWYLRSLTPAEAFAVFLMQRGHRQPRDGHDVRGVVIDRERNSVVSRQILRLLALEPTKKVER